MSFKLHLILAWFSCKLDVIFPTFHTSVKRRKITFNSSVFMQIRCNFSDISYLSETQKNNFQFLSKKRHFMKFPKKL